MRIRNVVVLVVFSASVLLSACSGPAAPTPSSTESSSPTPTATPGDDTRGPSPRIDLACAAAISRGSLDALFDPALTTGEAVALRRDETTPPSGWTEIQTRQQGGLRCVWGGASRTDSTYDTGIAFTALADAEAAYSVVAEPGDEVDTVGDRSWYTCGYGFCQFDVLVGGVWVEGIATIGASDPTRDEALRAAFVPVLEDVVAAIGAATIRPAEPLAPGVYAGWGPECGEGSEIVELLRSVDDESEIVPSDAHGDNAFNELLQSRVAVSSCVIGTRESGTYALVLEGAGWAVDELRRGESSEGYLDVTAIDLPDGTPAANACEGDAYCIVYVEVGGSLLRLSAEGSPAEVEAAAAAVASGLRN